MFFELIRKAPQHTLHFRDWDLYRPDRNPVGYQRMHNMQWLRDVINDHYDRELRERNREAHHAAVRQGVPGLWRPDGSALTAAPAPAPKKKKTDKTPSRRKRCPPVPAGSFPE